MFSFEVTLMKAVSSIISSMFTIWRPTLPESNDGKPLATAIGDLFWNFPYHRLPANHTLVALLMRPEVVLALVVFYWFSKRPLKALVTMTTAQQQQQQQQQSVDNKDNNNNNRPPTSSLSSSRIFRIAVAGHNLLLAVYSAITVLYSWPIVIQHLLEYGVYDTYCDPHKTLWHSGFGAWALVFYISKYYEFVDTWILILKVRIGSHPTKSVPPKHPTASIVHLSLIFPNSPIHTYPKRCEPHKFWFNDRARNPPSFKCIITRVSS
jgi:GNS1/SUR4 family